MDQKKTRNIGVGPEESRAAHESGGRAHPPGRGPLPRGRLRDPPDVKPTPKIPINTETTEN